VITVVYSATRRDFGLHRHLFALLFFFHIDALISYLCIQHFLSACVDVQCVLISHAIVYILSLVMRHSSSSSSAAYTAVRPSGRPPAAPDWVRGINRRLAFVCGGRCAAMCVGMDARSARRPSGQRVRATRTRRGNQPPGDRCVVDLLMSLSDFRRMVGVMSAANSAAETSLKR